MNDIRIHWFHEKDVSSLLALGKEEKWLMDEGEILHILHRFPTLCFGAYDGDFPVGFVTGYLHEKSAWIGNFVVKKDFRGKGIGTRLFETLLKVLGSERERVYLHAAPEAVKFYESYGFGSTVKVFRMQGGEGKPSFSFNEAKARALETAPYEPILGLLDTDSFGEDRSSLIFEDATAKSSLRMATRNGALHSRMIGSGAAFLGPWEVRAGAYMDAELLIRGLLFYRGSKKIYADVPQYGEILNLYEQYEFKKVGETVQMCLGEPLPFRAENIYAFASSGVCG